jgi:hypothetical protein
LSVRQYLSLRDSSPRKAASNINQVAELWGGAAASGSLSGWSFRAPTLLIGGLGGTSCCLKRPETLRSPSDRPGLSVWASRLADLSHQSTTPLGSNHAGVSSQVLSGCVTSFHFQSSSRRSRGRLMGHVMHHNRWQTWCSRCIQKRAKVSRRLPDLGPTTRTETHYLKT